MSDEVADLFASFGLKTDTSSFSKGGAALDDLNLKVKRINDRSDAALKRLIARGPKASAAAAPAADKIKDIADATDRAGHSAARTSEMFGQAWHLALLAGAYVGIHKAEEAFIGFNSEVQDAKIQLSAMISGMTGAEWGKATNQANALYNEFQRFSTTTPVTTQQILEFGKGIAAATFAAGGGVKELQNLTEQGVIAAKVLAGDRGAGYAQLEITELLSGTISKRMILARQLLSMGHISEQAWKALDGKGRIAALQKIFNSDAMNHARDAFGESFSGVTSTAWDSIQIALGKVGLPLFTAVTAKVKELNQWMAANSATVERFAKEVGEDLVSAFETAAGVIEFVTDHATFFEGVLIGLGVFITAFAVQAAVDWAIAFWPITLAIAAVAALHTAIKWLFDDTDDDADKASGSIDGFGEALDRAAGGNFDGVNQGLQDVTKNANKAAVAVAQLHDFYGNEIGASGLATGLEGIAPGKPSVPTVTLGAAHADATSDNARHMWGNEASLPRGVAAEQRAAAAPATVVKPQVNVVVTGNMPDGWIDAKIGEAIQDHHDTTWTNAAHALQAEDDE